MSLCDYGYGLPFIPVRRTTYLVWQSLCTHLIKSQSLLLSVTSANQLLLVRVIPVELDINTEFKQDYTGADTGCRSGSTRATVISARGLANMWRR